MVLLDVKNIGCVCFFLFFFLRCSAFFSSIKSDESDESFEEVGDVEKIRTETKEIVVNFSALTLAAQSKIVSLLFFHT